MVIIVFVFRGVAQVVERYFREVEAASSSLVTPIKEKILESLIFEGFAVSFFVSDYLGQIHDKFL